MVAWWLLLIAWAVGVIMGYGARGFIRRSLHSAESRIKDKL